MNSGIAVRESPSVFRLRHRIQIPKEPVDTHLVLGDRVRTTTFRVAGGRGVGAYGRIVAINIPYYRAGVSARPYQVLLDDCPNRLYRFGDNQLEWVDEEE